MRWTVCANASWNWIRSDTSHAINARSLYSRFTGCLRYYRPRRVPLSSSSVVQSTRHKVRYSPDVAPLHRNPSYSHLRIHRIPSDPCRMIAIFDEDGGGDVDFQEFVTGLSAFSSKGNKDEKLRFAFKVYDIDRDGYISNGELFIVLKMMVGNNLKDVQLQQIVDKTIMEADKDQDGKISFDEFKDMVENTDVSLSMTLSMFFSSCQFIFMDYSCWPFADQIWLSSNDRTSYSVASPPLWAFSFYIMVSTWHDSMISDVFVVYFLGPCMGLNISYNPVFMKSHLPATHPMIHSVSKIGCHSQTVLLPRKVSTATGVYRKSITLY